MKNNREGGMALIAILVVIIVCVAGTGALWMDYSDTHRTTLTIEKTYIDNNGDESYYMLATTDGRVYEVNNCWWHGQNAIDKEYAYLKMNSTYDVEYFGWDMHNFMVDYYFVIYHFEIVNETGR